MVAAKKQRVKRSCFLYQRMFVYVHSCVLFISFSTPMFLWNHFRFEENTLGSLRERTGTDTERLAGEGTLKKLAGTARVFRVWGAAVSKCVVLLSQEEVPVLSPCVL